MIRADSGFENHKLFTTLDRARRRVLDRRQAEQSTIRALIDQIPETDWVTVADYPDSGEAQIAETKLKGLRLIVRRTRLVGAQAELFPDWRHHCFATNRTVPTLIADIDHRDHATIELVIRDLKDQALAHFPSGRFARQQRLDRDRRPRAQPRTLDNPDRPPQPARPDRPIPPPSPASDPRPPDPHQPPMDTPDARPLALANRVHHRARRDPRAPRPHLNTPTRRDERPPAPPPDRQQSPLPENPSKRTCAQRPGPTHPTNPATRPANRSRHPEIPETRVTHPADRWFQAQRGTQHSPARNIGRRSGGALLAAASVKAIAREPRGFRVHWEPRRPPARQDRGVAVAAQRWATARALGWSRRESHRGRIPDIRRSIA